MATKAGTQAILYLGSTNAAAISETAEMAIEVSTDFAEDTAHGDTWRTFIPTLSTFNLSVTKHFDSAPGGGQLDQWVVSRTLLKFYLYYDRADATIYWYGTGYLGGGGATMGLEDVIDGSYTLQPSGQPTLVHP